MVHQHVRGVIIGITRYLCPGHDAILNIMVNYAILLFFFLIH